MPDVTTFMILAPAAQAEYFASAPEAFKAWMAEAFPRYSFAVLRPVRERSEIVVGPYQEFQGDPEDAEDLDWPEDDVLKAMAERADSFLVL